MEENQLKSGLEVLVENQLCFILKIITEGSIAPEKIDEEQQKEIISFINNLPKRYKELPNRDEIIVSRLNKMGIQTSWTRKKEKEFKIKKRMQNNTQKMDSIKKVKTDERTDDDKNER